MINIVCLKWGTKYGSEYVNRLYAGVKRHTTIPFNFHCFTEKPDDINSEVIIHPLLDNKIDGWWNKLYLFSNEIDITGRIFFIDLDTLIVGNIDEIMKHNKDFVVLRDFYKAERDIKATNIGSGLMSFEAHKYCSIWDTFIKDPQKIIKSMRPFGDQNWIQKQNIQHARWQDLFPEQVVSFKVHCANGLPNNARIICYHGAPSIPESIVKTTVAQQRTFKPAPWVADHWKD